MHKEGKIFCLVNADKLDYEVSKRAEKKFEEYSKGISGNRKLAESNLILGLHLISLHLLILKCINQKHCSRVPE